MKNSLILLLFVIVAACSNRGPGKEGPAGENSPDTVSIIPADAFPFQFSEKYIIVRVMINDSVEISLLLDTGAQIPVFDSTFIAENKERLGIKTKPTHGTLETPSGLFRISQQISGSVKLTAFGETEDYRGSLLITDLRKSNLDVDAIFPASLFFENRIVLINMQQQYFRILSPDSLNHMKNQFVSWPLLGNPYSFYTVSSKICLENAAVPPVNLKGELVIDIGAPGFMYLLKSNQSAAAAFSSAKKIQKIRSLSFDMKDTVDSEAFVAGALKLSDTLSFRNPRIILLHDFIASDSKQIGYLGNEFLRKFTVIIDYSDKQFYLRPGPEYYKSCSNSTLGMKLRKRSSGNSTIVSSIYSQSPIPGAGIQLGDVILSINDIPAEKLSAKEIGLYEQSPVGTKLRFRIKRDQEVFDREIIVEDIW